MRLCSRRLALALISSALPFTLPAAVREPPSRVRVLLVTGIDYPGHLWPQTAPALRELLEKDPRLLVRVVEDPAFLDSPTLAQYHVVVLHFMNWETPGPGTAARENLRRFVHGGKGLMLVHFACGAWQEWPGFVELAGRVWDPKKRPHDPRGPFRVDVAEPTHPIMQGLVAFETDDELYTCLAGEPAIQVLATARSKVDNLDYPIAFVRSVGEGRVFHTVLGHDVKALTSSQVPELLRRACAWAAGL